MTPVSDLYSLSSVQSRMATQIFVDKENREPGINGAPNDGLKLEFGPAVKALDRRSQISMPHICKMFSAPPALPKSVRKALGTVNRATEKSVRSNGPVRQKNQTSPPKR